MDNLNQSEIALLKYFWEEKGDLERWNRFLELKPKIQNQFPEIILAWDNYKTALKAMNNVINNIPE